jgi:phosphoenolpyruvate---glycerone phosphotransferase subunit DhaL
VRLLEHLIMGLTIAVLSAGVAKIRMELERDHELLTEADSRLGDGDLGITLLKAFRQLDEVAPSLASDLGQAFARCATEVSKVASSSFGTLIATAFIASAKRLKGRSEMPWEELSALLDDALTAMKARGKAELGDKTVLDALAPSARAVAGCDDPVRQLADARVAVDTALNEFRDRPCRIGRARIFGDKSIGMDDAGMVAFRFMLSALAAPTAA